MMTVQYWIQSSAVAHDAPIVVYASPVPVMDSGMIQAQLGSDVEVKVLCINTHLSPCRIASLAGH